MVIFSPARDMSCSRRSVNNLRAVGAVSVICFAPEKAAILACRRRSLWFYRVMQMIEKMRVGLNMSDSTEWKQQNQHAVIIEVDDGQQSVLVDFHARTSPHNARRHRYHVIVSHKFKL